MGNKLQIFQSEQVISLEALLDLKSNQKTPCVCAYRKHHTTPHTSLGQS